jgi:hypothetical protein
MSAFMEMLADSIYSGMADDQIIGYLHWFSRKWKPLDNENRPENLAAFVKAHVAEHLDSNQLRGKFCSFVDRTLVMFRNMEAEEAEEE